MKETINPQDLYTLFLFIPHSSRTWPTIIEGDLIGVFQNNIDFLVAGNLLVEVDKMFLGRK